MGYYAELADTVMKFEATAGAASSLGQWLARSESGYSFEPLSAAFEVFAYELAGNAKDVVLSGFASSATTAAAFGDCDPFKGTNQRSLSGLSRGCMTKTSGAPKFR